MSEPQVVEITVNFHGGGKVAIMEYGKISSEYGASLSRKYAIPEDWTEEQVAEFELLKAIELHDQLEPFLQQEFDERYKQRQWRDGDGDGY